MKEYEVAVWEEQSGVSFIKAKSQKDAENKIFEIVKDGGIEALKDFKVLHREVNILK